MPIPKLATAFLLSLPALLAQTSPIFEVASLKPAAPLPAAPGNGRVFAFGGVRGGPGTNSPGQVTATGTTLMNLLLRAYGVKPFQIVGPAWLNTEKYDLAAKVPPDTTKEQFNLMLQNLLIERFHIKLKRETKEAPIYALVVAKNGPKLKESDPEPPVDPNAKPPEPPALPSGPIHFSMGPDGFPEFPKATGGRGGLSTMMMNGRAKMAGTRQEIKVLAENLSNQVSRPVVNETGLTGKYDFTLIWQPDNSMGPAGRGSAADSGGPATNGGSPAVDTDLPTLFAAVQSQLGLKLEPKKGPVETLTIESADKVPVEN